MRWAQVSREGSMDDLGKRIVADEARIAFLKREAASLELQAKQLREEADEVRRLLDLARLSR